MRMSRHPVANAHVSTSSGKCACLDIQWQMRMSRHPVANRRQQCHTFHFHQYSQQYRAHYGTHILACLQNVQRSHLNQTTKITYTTSELQSSALHHRCGVNVISSTVRRVNENAYNKSASSAQTLRGRSLLFECYTLARYTSTCDFIQPIRNLRPFLYRSCLNSQTLNSSMNPI
jgi:hypothetical protein